MTKSGPLKTIFSVGCLLLLVGPLSACSLSPDQSPPPIRNEVPTNVNPTLISRPSSTMERKRISPEELAPNLNWGGWGGGGGEIKDCGDGIPNIYFTTYRGNSEPPNRIFSDQIAIGEIIYVNGCDFTPDQNVVVTTYLPTNNSEVVNLQADKSGKWTSTWYSLPGEPIGRYDVDVVASSGILKGYFTVSEQKNPTMLVDCSKGVKEGIVWLTGFQSSEEVLIARYEGPMSTDKNLINYFPIIVDQNGVGTFKIPKILALLIAIGQVSPYTQSKFSGDGTKYNVSAYNFCDPRND